MRTVADDSEPGAVAAIGDLEPRLFIVGRISLFRPRVSLQHSREI
jgi:hypothetical protein